MTYKQPTFRGSSFNCPHCGAYAHMQWESLWFQGHGWSSTNVFVVICRHCNERSYWIGSSKNQAGEYTQGQMVYPSVQSAPLPHAEMPPDIQKDYEEARNIASQSPRAAAALLRLCVQKLCKELGESGKNINDDIGSLVKKGLPVEIQQALDIVRVVGNNAVHPGSISHEDVASVCSSLFELVNYIVEDRIARPKKLSAMFSSLPQPALDGISTRDKS